DGESSDFVSVTSGVPQGSCLGPLLFIIYINDLINIFSCKCRLFADDLVLYQTITCNDNSILLQNNICKLENWCSLNSMDLNMNKSVSMTVTRLHSPNNNRTYVMGGVALNKVNSYKYLGIMISSNLCWQAQINAVALKA